MSRISLAHIQSSAPEWCIHRTRIMRVFVASPINLLYNSPMSAKAVDVHELSCLKVHFEGSFSKGLRDIGCIQSDGGRRGSRS